VEARQSKVPQLSDLRESGCLAEETPVYLADEGVCCPIGQLVGRRGFRVLALNPATMRLEAAPVTRAFATGCRPVYRLTTAGGRQIRATANHPFLTRAGWQRLDELRAGQSVAVALERARSSASGSDAGPGHLLSTAGAVEGDIVWDPVETIVPAGQAEVYDLTVAGLHNFVAADLVLHNSIEQDADVVMFIYRDDVYNPDSERKNIADIIVAKHRNGPVGEVSLYFQASHTRFCDLELSPPPE
jgi:replicative DNA helicase